MESLVWCAHMYYAHRAMWKFRNSHIRVPKITERSLLHGECVSTQPWCPYPDTCHLINVSGDCVGACSYKGRGNRQWHRCAPSTQVTIATFVHCINSGVINTVLCLCWCPCCRCAHGVSSDPVGGRLGQAGLWPMATFKWKYLRRCFLLRMAGWHLRHRGLRIHGNPSSPPELKTKLRSLLSVGKY